MASKKNQSASSARWHNGHGQEVKDRHVQKSSHGKYNSVAELEAHRQKVNPGNVPRKKSVK